MSDERRKTEGVAIITMRGEEVKSRWLAAGISARALSVQEGPAWPEHRPPVVLDTIGLPVEMLVVLLADPPKVHQSNAQQQPAIWANVPPPTQPNPWQDAPFVPIAALADGADWRTLRLLALCPAVRLIGPDDPDVWRQWIGHLAAMRAPQRAAPAPAWLIPSPPPLRLDPLLLRALAVFQRSPSVRIAAERCKVSESTMARLLRTTRNVLGMPSGDVFRFRPAEQAALILERLASALPAAQKQPPESRTALH
jgi:hypothetical protein